MVTVGTQFNLNNLLTSGLRFSEEEEPLSFRIRFLNAVIVIDMIASIVFILLDQFGVRLMGHPTRLFTILQAVIPLLAMVYLRGRKSAYRLCVLSVIAMSYVTFNSALFYMPNDELRVIWYLPLVVGAYVLLGNMAGLTATVFSVLTVTVAKFGFDIYISNGAYFTFVMTLGVASGMTYAYTNLVNSYYERMTHSYQQMRELASKDPLTGLWNTRVFYELANKLFQLGQRNATPNCMMFMDLDHFKSINDRYGHATGDVVLKAVATCIASHGRESDVFGRIGGEEFVAFLPNTDAEGAMILAEKIRFAAASLVHIFPSNDQGTITLSIGLAQSRATDTATAALLKRADTAMYEAKKRGRNRVSLSI